MATIAQAAKHVDMGERRFHELLAAGVIKKAGRGKYDLDKVRVAYIRHIRKQAGESGGQGFGQFEDRRRLDRAKADAAEMELAEKRLELIPIAEIRVAFSRRDRKRESPAAGDTDKSRAPGQSGSAGRCGENPK